MDRPNVLWVMSDQHHAGCFGAGGRGEVRTPALDGLAGDGVVFDRAYCNVPICGPSRCSMIAGQYAHTTGITGNAIFGLKVPIPAHGTVATRLKTAGYRTALVGKGHMIDAWDQAGFDTRHYCDLCDADRGDPTTVGYFQHLIDHGLADAYDLGSRKADEPGAGLNRFISELSEENVVETWTGDKAVETLDDLQAGKQKDGRPWMMQLSFQRPHEPLCLPPERANDYDPNSLKLPENSVDFFERKFAGKPAHQQAYVNGGVMGYPYRPHDEADLRGQLAYYYTLVTMIDRQIGRVIERLKATGAYENTLILYTADHGDFAGEHGLILKNMGIYEAIHRVPLVVKWPAAAGLAGGTRRDGIVELVDLMPTFLAAAGEAVPEACHGRDLLPVAKGEAGGLGHTVCTYDFFSPQPKAVAVRDDRWRLVLYPEQPGATSLPGELYDHVNDPGELDNRFADAAATGVRLRLTEAAFVHLNGFRRVHGIPDDADDPTTLRTLVQKDGMKWSQLART